MSSFDRPARQFEQLAVWIDQAPAERINVVDAGCYRGGFTRELERLLPQRALFTIGVDPLPQPDLYPFSRFFQVAVSRNDGQATFYEYDDAPCNSLYVMTDQITHDRAERLEQWYVARDLGGVKRTHTVTTRRLDGLIEESGLGDQVVHCVKLDVQGADLDGFLSLGARSDRCLFIQMETIYNAPVTLYEGQSRFEEERPQIESKGFQLVSLEDHGKMGGSSEADVIYANTALAHELGVKLPDRAMLWP